MLKRLFWLYECTLETYKWIHLIWRSWVHRDQLSLSFPQWVWQPPWKCCGKLSGEVCHCCCFVRYTLLIQSLTSASLCPRLHGEQSDATVCFPLRCGNRLGKVGDQWSWRRVLRDQASQPCAKPCCWGDLPRFSPPATSLSSTKLRKAGRSFWKMAWKIGCIFFSRILNWEGRSIQSGYYNIFVYIGLSVDHESCRLILASESFFFSIHICIIYDLIVVT